MPLSADGFQHSRNYTSARMAGERYPRLLLGVKTFMGISLLYCLYALIDEPLMAVLGAAAIVLAAMLPAYLWAAGYRSGLPVLPLHATTLVWTFALPLVAGHPEIANYDPDEIAWSAAMVVLYTLVATVVWLLVARNPHAPRSKYYVLPNDRGYLLLVLALALGGTFILLVVSHSLSMDAGMFGILRGVLLAFSAVACFVLAFRLGRRELSQGEKWGFAAAAALYLVAQLSTIYLVGAIIGTISLLIGFSVGRRAIPWAVIIVATCFFGLLHSGKGEMRERYWDPEPQPIAWYAVPGFLASWTASGVKVLVDPEDKLVSQPLYERISLVHLLLFVQRMSPDSIPYLMGETYAVVPHLLVPRVIDPDKPTSHAGTSILSVHYGFQSIEGTASTTIGWGLINEAYANFGAAGIVALAIFIGLLLGFAGRITIGAPIMSLANLVGVTFAATAIQTEFTMGVFSTVLFQSMVSLALVLPFLERRPVESPG